MNLDEEIRRLKERIRELKARMPAHSPRIEMLMELEELESRLYELCSE